MTTQTETRAPQLIRAIPLGKDSGKSFNVELHRVLSAASVAAIAADEMLRNIVLVGTSRIFVDTQASAKTDAERLAAVQKKHDAWLAGDFNVRGGGGSGETVEGEVKRLLLAAFMENSGQSLAKAEAALKGKGFEVLANIAKAKANALCPIPAAAGDEPTEAEAAAIREATEARDRKAHELLEASKADWTKRAEASLAAKATAREAAKGFDMTSLLG